MSAPPFRPSRENGKSDRTVIAEMVKDAAPGTVFTFDDIVAALRVGTDREIDEHVAGAAVRAANPLVLRDQQRCLHAVKGVGYRLAHASEHQPLAVARRRRADAQMQRGLQVLQNVRWDELTTTQREAHEGTLLVVGALSSAMKALDARQDRLESLIEKLKQPD